MPRLLPLLTSGLMACAPETFELNRDQQEQVADLISAEEDLVPDVSYVIQQSPVDFINAEGKRVESNDEVADDLPEGISELWAFYDNGGIRGATQEELNKSQQTSTNVEARANGIYSPWKHDDQIQVLVDEDGNVYAKAGTLTHEMWHLLSKKKHNKKTDLAVTGLDWPTALEESLGRKDPTYAVSMSHVLVAHVNDRMEAASEENVDSLNATLDSIWDDPDKIREEMLKWMELAENPEKDLKTLTLEKLDKTQLPSMVEAIGYETPSDFMDMYVGSPTSQERLKKHKREKEALVEECRARLAELTHRPLE